MNLAAAIVSVFSVLIPARMWVAPNQPMMVSVKSDAPVRLVLTDFSGRVMEPKGAIDAAPGKEIDLRQLYTRLGEPGAYVLYAVPAGKATHEFLGTPLVITVRTDKRPGAPTNEVMATKIEPLRYVVMTTEHGPMTMAFYYDSAPNTVTAIQTSAEQGFYNGLTFHRIVPGFVIQGGDPKGDGTGGPGFQIDAEFNDRRHDEGVLSMARNGDPLERTGQLPRHEFANSAGSQFFVCLETVPHLDNRYTAFGKVVAGQNVYKTIALTPLADKEAGRPQKAPIIQKTEVFPVSAENNPYLSIMPNLKPEPSGAPERKAPE